MESSEEPQESAPVPSPHPSSCLEVNNALDLTPEKPVRRKKNRRPVQLKQHNFNKGENNHVVTDCRSPEAKLCAELAVPGFNTTAPLYHQLQQYKQSSEPVKKRERDPQSVVMEDPLPVVDAHQSSAKSSVDSEEDVFKTGRYSDLVTVDISDESFQRLTTCPRKVYPTASGRGREKIKKGYPTVEPNIMDFFSEDFEVEDVGVESISTTTHSCTLPEPIVPSNQSALTLYHFIRSS